MEKERTKEKNDFDHPEQAAVAFERLVPVRTWVSTGDGDQK